ncbi:hypothetical protein BDV12DRAFT_170481 [Aspergillus spectabilis]
MAAKRKRSTASKVKNNPASGKGNHHSQPPEKKTKKSTKSRKKAQKQQPEVHSQEQSWFFQLPGEIRNMIYREIFISPVTIHLAYVGGKSRKFRSFPCKLSEADQPETRQTGTLCSMCKIRHHLCSPRDKHKRGPAVQLHPTEHVRRNARVMGVLRCCRRIYSETIDMLYGQNTFYIENPRTILELPKYMSQAKLSLFQNFHAESPMYGYWNAPDCLERWAEVVTALERFNGLKSLCIILQPGFGNQTALEALEKPLKTANLPALRVLNAPFPILEQDDGAQYCERHQSSG